MAQASGHAFIRSGNRGDVWYLKYRLPDGRQLKRRLGPAWKERGRPPAGHFTRRTAEAALRELLADAQRGRLANGPRTGATFADAAAEWLRYVADDRKRRPSTVENYRLVLRRHLVPEFGDLPIEVVTSDVIDDYRARLAGEGRLADRTINKQLLILHAIFKRAQRVFGLHMNPVTATERQPVRSSGDFEVLSSAEVEALVRSAASKQDAALFTVAAFTGLRMGELRGLRWLDIDFSRRLVHVRRSYTLEAMGDPKSGRVRSVPMVDQVLRALDGLSQREQFTADDDLVFVGETGGVIDNSALRRRYKAALARAGPKRLRFHDLRHTFGTLAVQVFPLSDVRAFMGHASIQTTMIYVHHVPQHDAADRLSRAISGQGDYSVNGLERAVRSP